MRNAEPWYLALDQGGHSSRALVMSPTGEIIAKAQEPIETQAISDTRVEHIAEELAQSLRTCCDQIAEQLGADCQRIAHAGLATQRSSIVCWRRSNGAALTPVLSWQDRRAASLIDSNESSAALIQNLTGLVMSAHYGASKLRWCLDNLDEVQKAKTQDDLTIGPLASYLVRSLTSNNQDVCDPANASRTLLWNRHTRQWSDRLCEVFGIDRSLLPESVPTRHSFGLITLGSCSIPLTLVTGDQSAAIYAFGKANSDTAFVNLGTGAFMQCPIGDTTADAEGLLNSVVYTDKTSTEYVLEGTVNGAGRALTWWSDQHGQDSKSMVRDAVDQYADSRFANQIPIFLNGISGLGSPFWLSDFQSVFIDARGRPVEPDVLSGAMAILDSIAFLLNENIQRTVEHTKLERLVLTGGLASVDYLCQSLATVTEYETTRSSLREATAKGVGFLLSQDDSWPGARELVAFQPAPDSLLVERHSRWRDELTQALSKHL